MCGIVGTFEYGSQEAADLGAVRSMMSAIEHRGPDDDGTYRDGPVALGMRRLSIIDVEGGRQPMTNEDGTVVVVFNGEIYNHRELRARLRTAGHRFGTSSDTEVLPHLFEDLGADLVDELRGMFGLAVWDAGRRRLVLARDRLGIKPLYVLDDGRRLVFASEIKALVRHPAVDRSPDLTAVSQYLTLRYVPAPRTMFAGISSLPPGSVLVCDGDGPKVHRYWDLPAPVADERRREEDWADDLAAHLRASVALHVQSDVPFGAFLSGGLDSSTVVALMSEILPDPVRTYSVGFVADGAPTGELPHAALVARHFGTRHHELVMTGRDFAENAERLVWHLDQPLGDVATIPMLLLSDLAGRDVKMVLSGEGGDELFGGYARHVGQRAAPLVDLLPAAMRAGLFGLAARRTSRRRLRNVFDALSQRDPVDRIASWFPLLGEDLRRQVVSARLAAIDGPGPRDVFAAALAGAGTGDPLARMLYCDTRFWLPDLLLARADRMSMAASLELRVPLLDHHVVEFAASVPSSLKVRGLTRKALLRRVARDLLPAPVLERRKEGFPVPVDEWFREDARDLLRDTLSADGLRRRGLLDPAAVGRLLDDHETGRGDHGFVLWGLAGLELWFRRFIDAPRPTGVDRTAGHPA